METNVMNQNTIEKKYESTLLQELIYLLGKILSVLVVATILFTFVFGIFRNPDLSMNPAIKEGDLVLFYRFDKSYIRGETVAIKYNDNYQVRRVLAVAGDTVDIKEDGLYINGYRQIESDIYSETYAFEEGIVFPITVADNEIFVMGDNREKSTDSRIYGTINIQDTLGKVMTILRRRSI